MSTVDKEALKRKYSEERAKRLRTDGNDQYVQIEGQFDHYLEDPYTPVTPRESRTDHVTVAIIGGGFAGLLTGARLKEAGIADVRLIEKGGDFGGTWYWNRYPGAQCDTTSFIYLPLLEETGHMPTEKYAHGPEILEHSRRIGRQFGLYDGALFHTRVTEAWDDERSRWIIRTDRGDAFTAQFVSMGTGPLHIPKLPGIPGIESFRGHSFHTSRWDYAYTGGDSIDAPMDKLADKRVAVIGTGATAVQCVPQLAPACQKLYVFQRTPSSVDVRDNRPTDPEWFKEFATPGWQKRWLENFAAVQTGLLPEEDLTQDGWTDIARRVRSKIMTLSAEEFTPEGMLRAFEDSDFEKMEEIRARVDAIVADTATAQRLKAWYRQLCKRPCFHDEYLQSFNLPSTEELVDTDGKGVERITEQGLVVAGVEYEVDCIIYASGFEVGTAHTRRMGFDPIGRDGLRLSDYWSEGMRTKHGMFVHGFPNLFIVQVQHGANLISNVPHNLTEAGKTIGMLVKHALDSGVAEVEVTKQAEDAWLELLHSGPGTFLGTTECTPGYYNQEGQPTVHGRDFLVGFPLGAMAYFEYLDSWRKSGTFEGLELRGKS